MCLWRRHGKLTPRNCGRWRVGTAVGIIVYPKHKPRQHVGRGWYGLRQATGGRQLCSQGCCLFQSRNVVCLDHRKPSFCGSQLFLDLPRASQSASHHWGSGESPTNTAGTPSPLYVAPAASPESARRHGWYPTRSCLARKSPARRLVAHAHHTAGRCRPVPGGSEALYSWNHGLSWHCL